MVVEKNVEESYVLIKNLEGRKIKIQASKAQLAIIELNKQYFISYEYNLLRKPHIVNIQIFQE